VVFIWTTIAAFWYAGERAEWSPDFSAKPLPASALGNATPEDVEGARLFHSKGCEFCHAIEGYGGKRGPDLTVVGGRMTHDQIVARITNGSANMPAYTRILRPDEVQTLSEFLARRR
jgi:ubiquinol-cytochrome c reductase cytochrome b subunit